MSPAPLHEDTALPPGSRFRGAALLLPVLAAVGVLALLFYFHWWAVPGRLLSPWLLLALALMVLYAAPQVVGVWLLYLAAGRRREHPGAGRWPKGLTVDVFVTACGEPDDLVEASLVAARALRGEHRTWLLDDGADPALALLARRLGVGYLTRPDRNDAKAGNVSAALPRTSGDVIAIFDVDHAPTPEFLERTVGCFVDPRIGFVQAMLTFRNGSQSWIAHVASEMSLDFYNPTSMGMDALGSVTMMGSNSLIRRSALVSIGGYRPGLAEDLATSIALHAHGWRSAYVAEPLAPGFVPATVAAWFTQQLKWARGVFQVLLTDYPRLFRRLTWGQRLSYAVRMTYYWFGTLVAAHLGVTAFVLMSGSRAAQSGFQEYLLGAAPVSICFVLMQRLALFLWRHPDIRPNPLWRSVALVYFTWPVYTLAWVMALLRVPLAFRLTPKSANGSIPLTWVLPQIGGVVLLVIALFQALLRSPAPVGGGALALLREIPVVLGFTALQCALPLLALSQRLRRERPRAPERPRPVSSTRSLGVPPRPPFRRSDAE